MLKYYYITLYIVLILKNEFKHKLFMKISYFVSNMLLIKKKTDLFLANFMNFLVLQNYFNRILLQWKKELLLILRLPKKQELHLLTEQKLNILKSIHLQTKNN